MIDQVVAMIRQAGAAKIDRVGIASKCGVDIKLVNSLVYNMRRKGEIPPPQKLVLVASCESFELRFNGLYHAEAEGFEVSSIKRCVAGKRKTHAGFTWRYEVKDEATN